MNVKVSDDKFYDAQVLCPKTGKRISTGLVFTKTAFVTGNVVGMSVLCPLCRGVHPWRKEEVILVELK